MPCLFIHSASSTRLSLFIHSASLVRLPVVVPQVVVGIEIRRDDDVLLVRYFVWLKFVSSQVLCACLDLGYVGIQDCYISLSCIKNVRTASEFLSWMS